MDIKNPNESNKNNRLFIQSVEEIETDYQKDIDARTTVKKSTGLLQGGEELQINQLSNKKDAIADALDTTVFRSVIIGTVSGIILINGILYPKLLKIGRLLTGKESKKFFNNFLLIKSTGVKKYLGLKAGGIGVLALHLFAICPMFLVNGIYLGCAEGYAISLMAKPIAQYSDHYSQIIDINKHKALN